MTIEKIEWWRREYQLAQSELINANRILVNYEFSLQKPAYMVAWAYQCTAS